MVMNKIQNQQINKSYKCRWKQIIQVLLAAVTNLYRTDRGWVGHEKPTHKGHQKLAELPGSLGGSSHDGRIRGQ